MLALDDTSQLATSKNKKNTVFKRFNKLRLKRICVSYYLISILLSILTSTLNKLKSENYQHE